jgi:hypothetical protein
MEAQSKFAQFYQGNRFLVNAVISLGGLAVLTFATIAIVKAVRKPSNEEGQNNEENGANEENGNNNGASQGTYGVNDAVTITASQAQQYASKLLDAFDHTWGTDEAAIESVFSRLETNGDVKMVYNAFGVKPYSSFGTGGTPWISSGTAKNLTEWLREEAYCSDIPTACKKMEDAGYLV